MKVIRIRDGYKPESPDCYEDSNGMLHPIMPSLFVPTKYGMGINCLDDVGEYIAVPDRDDVERVAKMIDDAIKSKGGPNR